MRSLTILFILLFLLSTLLVSCAREKETTLATKTIEQVLKENTDQLMSIPGVVGTAIGSCDGSPCIKVLVEKKTPELQNRIPTKLDSWKVEIEEVGKVRAL